MLIFRLRIIYPIILLIPIRFRIIQCSMFYFDIVLFFLRMSLFPTWYKSIVLFLKRVINNIRLTSEFDEISWRIYGKVFASCLFSWEFDFSLEVLLIDTSFMIFCKFLKFSYCFFAWDDLLFMNYDELGSLKLRIKSLLPNFSLLF